MLTPQERAMIDDARISEQEYREAQEFCYQCSQQGQERQGLIGRGYEEQRDNEAVL